MSVLDGLSIEYRPYYERFIDVDLWNPLPDFALTQHVKAEMEHFEKTGEYRRPPRERFPNIFNNLGKLNETPNPIVREKFAVPPCPCSPIVLGQRHFCPRTMTVFYFMRLSLSARILSTLTYINSDVSRASLNRIESDQSPPLI